jgi:phage tail sheath protein FI
MGGKKRGGKRGAKRGSWLSPGVFVEEVPAGSRPIAGVGTAVAAFVGLDPPNPARTAAVGLVVVAVVAVAVRVVRARSG